MREILFRGEDVETGDWVKGQYVRLFDDKGNRHHRIYPGYAESDCGDLYPDWYEVDPETVGQFAGLTDKNGKKIFEGDMFYSDEMTAVVIFKDGSFRLELHGLCGAWTGGGFDECGGGYGIIECEPIDWVYIHDMEIIGNIHDNPELLEGNQ